MRRSEVVAVGLRGHQLEAAEVMAVRFAIVALTDRHQMEELGTYAVKLNVLEVQPR